MAAKKKEAPKFDPELLAALKAELRREVLEDLKSQRNEEEAQAQKEREDQERVRAEFVEKMKASTEPWVDIIMWVSTPTGVKYELDWNDAFIKHLEKEGVKGVDEEQTIQKWVALLLHDAAGNMEENSRSPLESEFE